MSTKPCSRCHIEKPTSAFHKSTNLTSYGKQLQPYCKTCINEYKREWRIARKALRPKRILPQPTVKLCRECRIDKPITAFDSYHRKGRQQLRSKCAECLRALRRRKFEHTDTKQKELKRAESRKRMALVRSTEGGRRKLKDANLRSEFGITINDYEQMVANQNGCCDICKQPERQTRNGMLLRLSVDHDHFTGKIRSLLCRRCNALLGHANDSTAILTAAIDYLKTHSASNVTVATHHSCLTSNRTT